MAHGFNRVDANALLDQSQWFEVFGIITEPDTLIATLNC